MQCATFRFPNNKPDGTQICDPYENIWEYDAQTNNWIPRGAVTEIGIVTEDEDGLVPPDVQKKLQKLREYSRSIDLTPFKLLPGIDAYWYYLKSSDKTIRFTPESESNLRIEVDRGRLYNIIYRQICPGDTGPKGDTGASGPNGKPGPNELCYSGLLDSNRIYFNIYTPVPLIEGGTIDLTNDHVPDIAVRMFRIIPAGSEITNAVFGPSNATWGSFPSQIFHTESQLDYLLIYYHDYPDIARHYQQTRTAILNNMLVSQCSSSLSPVLILSSDYTLYSKPVVTILIDPTGSKPPRLELLGTQLPIDQEKTLESVSYDPNTGLVCGYVYLSSGTWDSGWCIKSRQRGLDGRKGDPGQCRITIKECFVDDTNILATCPIVNTRLDCHDNTIYTLCSDISNELCLGKIQLLATAADLAETDFKKSIFAAAEQTTEECKRVNTYTLDVPADTPPELELQHWDPQPGCQTQRHYDRQKFDWIPRTDIPACDSLATWFSPTDVRAGKYPWSIQTANAPEVDQCCQEDFWYCNNAQAPLTPALMAASSADIIHNSDVNKINKTVSISQGIRNWNSK